MAIFTKEEIQEIRDLAATQKNPYQPTSLDTYVALDNVVNFQELDYKSNQFNERENGYG